MPKDWMQLASLPESKLAKIDVARVNLICAQDLCGAESLNVATALAKLDLWASFVAGETERLRPQFAERPEYYDNSEVTFRIVTMVLTLKNTLGVRYNTSQALNPTFENSRDQFLHGLTDSANGGTCVSMPVLAVAVGRRLGYPLKLALAHEHVFFRWDDGAHPPVNFECTNIEGMDQPPDEFYLDWPRRITAEELEAREFLVSLTPREELSLFVVARGHCLLANGRVSEARQAYRAALALFPTATQYRTCLNELESTFAPRLPTFSVPDPSVLSMQPMMRDPRTPGRLIPRPTVRRNESPASLQFTHGRGAVRTPPGGVLR